MNNTQLESTLNELRLLGMARTLDVRLSEALASRLSHEEFLTLALQDELNIRRQNKLATRSRAAGFHESKTLENFDWSFLGQPGLGKSHLSQAIGHEAIKQGFRVLRRSIFDLVRDLIAEEAMQEKELALRQYLKPDLLIIEDFAGKHLPQRSGEYLLEIVMRRYEKRSILITSNRPLEDWGKLFQDVPIATAILDRLLHHCHVVTFVGRSKRWSGSVSEADDPPAKTKSQ
jgi:DNA replication protein DnaC